MAKKSAKAGESKQTEEESMELFREKYLKAQVMDQQMKQMQKYVEAFDQQLGELQALIAAVKGYGDLKKGDKIFAPLANGIFLRAQIEEPDSLAVNVGSGVVLKKTIPEVIGMLEEQEKEMVQIKSQTLAQVEELARQMEGLELV